MPLRAAIALGQPEHGAGIVEPHFARAELTSEKRQNAGAGADIRDRALPGANRLRERRAKRVVAYSIGEHASMKLDRHARQCVIAYRM